MSILNNDGLFDEIQDEQREGWAPDHQRQLAEKDAQILALREALQPFAHCVSATYGNFAEWTFSTEVAVELGHLRNAAKALSTSPPPMVPLEEARALANALEHLRDEQNGPPLERHKDHWQIAYDNANQTLADFKIKHPTTK